MALWQRTKSNGKVGFDKVYSWVDKLGAPVNNLSNKIGSEAFWPTTLDKESDKAARILKSFCKDGFYQDEDRTSSGGPTSKQRVLKKIPPEVIKNAKGLAIFTTMRTGLWVSGSGGSGILVAHNDDGTWSPPSGLVLHTVGVGFLVGVDVYDCVVVLNTQQALDAFSKFRCTLGGEISAVAGPVGIGGILDSELHKRQAPIFTYMKSRGFYAGVQLDGTILIERADENERFYRERIAVADILAGKVRHPPYETRKLMETIKAAQGDSGVNESLIPQDPPPGDFEIQREEDTKSFGIPAQEDPDPYGVLALQSAGLEIREAGSQKTPTSEQFEFKPSPTSPIYNVFRKSLDYSSIDSSSRRSSWRNSALSSVPESQPSKTDISTQTNAEAAKITRTPPPLPPRRSSHTSSPKLPEIPEATSTDDAKTKAWSQKVREVPKAEVSTVVEELALDAKDIAPEVAESRQGATGSSEAEEPIQDRKDGANDDWIAKASARISQAFLDVDLDDDAEDDEVVIQEIQQAAAPQVVSRPRVVTVHKPLPPKLPQRNPERSLSSYLNSSSTAMLDGSAGPSLDTADSPRSTSTPSLKNDGSSISSGSSIYSLDETVEHENEDFQSNVKEVSDEKVEDLDVFHSVPASPNKTIPGAFS